MPNEDLLNLLTDPCHTAEDVVKWLQELERCFSSGRDLRGVFATAYLQISEAISAELAGRGFEDNDWSEAYMVRFANLYREALLHWEAGETATVSKAWRISFELARKQEGFIIQHLLLGINAHINHDLALALVQAGLDSDREKKYRDHTRINQILGKATEELKSEVADRYAPILNRIDEISGEISNDVANFSIPKAREHAWTFAVALDSARSEKENSLLKRSLDEQAAVIARLIIASPLQHPKVRETVSFLKRLNRFVDRVIGFFKS